MPKEYIVQQGEHLSSIAADHGFPDYLPIWNHPDNAALKAQRKDPNILFPGDVVVIPEQESKTVSGETEKRHTFVVTRRLLKLRIVLRDEMGLPLANIPCKLTIEEQTWELNTDANGLLEHDISPYARTAQLLVQDSKTGEEMEFPVRLGDLDPVDELSGMMARLNNLGYDAGNLDTPEAERFSSSVEEFQCDHGLDVDGKCGPMTQAKLKEIHGC
jgi:hypothetical protein